MRELNFTAFFVSTHRLINSCSTPLSSGNSDKIVVPPSPTIKSETYPKVGFAEIPEKPSEPPHSKPIINLLNEAGFRTILLASINPINVFLTAAAKNSFSELLCCCSRMYTGFLLVGDIVFKAVSKILAWAC